MTEITRRSVTALLAAAAVHAFPGVSVAQARRFAVASITGSWEVAFREILIPAFRAANNNPDVALDALIGLEQIAKVTASKGNPPLDTMLLDTGPALYAEAGLVEHSRGLACVQRHQSKAHQGRRGAVLHLHRTCL